MSTTTEDVQCDIPILGNLLRSLTKNREDSKFLWDISEKTTKAISYSASEKTFLDSDDDSASLKPEDALVLSTQKDARLVSMQMFDGALDGSVVLKKVAKCVEARGFTPENTLYAQSVCPDEINHEEGDITNIMSEYFGEVFHLGGLAGLPFSGKTGFGAFSHHVPDGGHCFVLMAPHIGISETFKLGKYTRDGQGSNEGTACGAAIGAFQHCRCKSSMPSAKSDALDYQMNFLIRKVNTVTPKILARCKTEDEKMVAVVHEIWKVAKNLMLDEMVHPNFGDENSKLLVLTGIQINMPRPFEDMFQPLTFTMLSKPEKKKMSKFSKFSKQGAAKPQVIDLYQETFGRKAPVIA